MATLRKYAKPLAFRQGGRVPVLDDMPIADDAPAEAAGFPDGILGDHPPAETSLAAKEVAPVEEPNPLQRALDAQKRAEELQPLANQIDSWPISNFKKSFLKQHPELVLDSFRHRLIDPLTLAGIRAGILDDTPEMAAHVLAGVDRELKHVRQQAIENVRMPAIESEPVPVTEPEPTKKGDAPLFAPPVAASPPARRSIPMSAPVSRDAPTYSGRAQSESVGITLSAEERDIARRSYSAPDMTDAQKEYAYAKAKQRLRKLRADGSYPESERN